MTSTPPSRRRARTGAAITITITGLAYLATLAAVTGCASSPQATASPAAATVTVTAGPSSAPASTGSSAPAPSGTAAPAPSSATPSAPGAVPVLGQPAGVYAHGTGFGQVRPSRIFNGGDPSGLVTGVTWKSWGGARATGSGTTVYVGPGQSVATGTEETATVVAFHLGTCNGKLMYRALEWYFPQHGQAFSPTRYENICTGTYAAG